jgi:hypothetical protein
MKLLPLASLLTVGCVLTIGFVLIGAPSAAGQSILLDALPEDTMAVLAVDDIDGLKAKWAESTIGRLWADAAFDAAREEIAAFLDEADGEALEEMGVSPIDLLGKVHGPACFAVITFEPLTDDEGGDIDGAAAWMFDTGDDLDVFSEDFDRLIDWLAESKGLVLKVETYGDLDVAVLVDPEHETTEVRYGFVDTVLLVTTEDTSLGRDVFGEIVDGLASDGESAFSKDSPYRKSVAADPAADVRLWVDLGEMLRRNWEAEGVAGQDESDFDLEEMGITLLGALSAAVDFAPGVTEAKAHLEFTGIGWIQEVLLAGISGQQPTMANWIPDGATMAYTVDIDLAGMFDAFLGITMERDPEEARTMISAMAEMEEDIGFHPRDDLLDNMDGQIAFFLAEVPAGEGMPMVPADPPVNYALMMGLSDGEAMSATLDGVIRSQGLHAARQLQEFDGYTIYSVPVFPGMSAHYAVLDDLMVLSLSPSMVKDVLRRKGNEDLPSLMTVEDVVRRNKVLPSERTVFGCQDAAEQMAGALTSLEVIPLILSESGVDLMDIDPALVSLLGALTAVDPEVIEKYYRDMFSLNSITLSETGILMVSTGP